MELNSCLGTCNNPTGNPNFRIQYPFHCNQYQEQQQFYLKDLDNTPFQLIFHFFAIIFYYTIIRLLIVVPGPVNQQAIEDTWKQWDEYLAIENQRNTEHVKARKSQRSQRVTIQEDPEDHSCVEYDDEELDDMDEGYKLQLKTQRKIELLDKPGRRFCKKCCIPKPPRTHHCSQCRSCWQKMDHHCQWINNCVAVNNYKLFFVMIFYASILLIIIAVNQYKIFLAAIQEEEVPDFQLFVIVLHYYFVLLLAVLISGFFIFHVFLTCQNKTTLEYLEEKPDRSNYNMGLIKNLQYILGNNPLLWALPI